jgi:hypothetical protein
MLFFLYSLPVRDETHVSMDSHRKGDKMISDLMSEVCRVMVVVCMGLVQRELLHKIHSTQKKRLDVSTPTDSQKKKKKKSLCGEGKGKGKGKGE